jgi:hypothetical protein
MAEQKICSICGTVGYPKTITRGSIMIEIILWLCFLVPGLLYSIWRLTTRTANGCPSCGSTSMIPLNSPIARQLNKSLNNHDYSNRPTDTGSFAYKLGKKLSNK